MSQGETKGGWETAELGMLGELARNISGKERQLTPSGSGRKGLSVCVAESPLLGGAWVLSQGLGIFLSCSVWSLMAFAPWSQDGRRKLGEGK